MNKTIFSLAALLFSLSPSFSTIANAAVVSPIDDNSAVKFVLPAPATQYYDFTMTMNGQTVKIGQPMPVDGPGCLKMYTEVRDLNITYRSEFCGQYLTGKTIEIPLPSISLTGAQLLPDTIFSGLPVPFTFGTLTQPMFEVKRLAHDFALPKLIPFATNEPTLKISTALKEIKLTADATTAIFEVKNPSDQRPAIVFTRVGTKAFPDARPLDIYFNRQGAYTSYWSTAGAGAVRFEHDVQTFTWLKMPWDTNDIFRFCQTADPTTTAAQCNINFTIGGVDGSGKLQPSTYPTAVNVNRIDVDDVVVNSADGSSAKVPGTYTVTDDNVRTTIAKNAKTKTGVDVLPGSYSIVVAYKDPFTLVNETKIYKLDFK